MFFMASPVVSLTSAFGTKMSNEKSVQECDATKMPNELKAGKPKINFYPYREI